MKNLLVSLNLGGVTRLVNVPVPVADTDVVNKGFVVSEIQKAISGLDYQSDVLGIQTDNTLVPYTTVGSRYVITNAASLNAAFGTIADVGNNDIVEYNGSAFVVAYDVSVKGAGALVFNRGDNQFYRFTDSWSYGGFSAVTAGTGLENADGTFNVKFDDVTIGIDGNGKLYVKNDSITKDKINADVAGLGLTQDADGSLKIKLDGDSLAVGANGIKFNKTILGKVTANVGDGAATSIDVAHTLGTKDLQVSVYDHATDNLVDCGVHRATDKVTLIFDVAPAANSIDVVIIG